MLTITGDSPSSCSNDLGATKTWRLLTATLARPYLTLGDVEPAEAMYKQALQLEGGLGLQSRTRPSTSREGGAGCGHVQVDRLTARGDSGKFNRFAACTRNAPSDPVVVINGREPVIESCTPLIAAPLVSITLPLIVKELVAVKEKFD